MAIKNPAPQKVPNALFTSPEVKSYLLKQKETLRLLVLDSQAAEETAKRYALLLGGC